MDDLAAKRAHIESMRPIIGDAAADAALAALGGAPVVRPTTEQHIDLAENASNIASPQASAGGDMRDNALGSGNVVLHDITIAEGGTLIVGELATAVRGGPDMLARYQHGLGQLLARIAPAHPRYAEALLYQQRLLENLDQTRRYGDTETRRAERAAVIDQLNALALAELGQSFGDLCGPVAVVTESIPAAAIPAVQQALATYLRTLLERYQFLGLQGLGAGGSRQLHIRLGAVFVNLHTDHQIAEVAALFGTDAEAGRSMRQRRRTGPSPTAVSPEVQQWLDELLTAGERALVLGAASQARLEQRDRQLEAVRQRLLAPRTALELIRHHRALVLLGDPGSGKTTVLRHLALGFASARLNADQPDAIQLDPQLAWAGPLPLPILVQLRRFAEELAPSQEGGGALLAHIERALGNDRLHALAEHLQARLEAGQVVLLLDGLDEIADDTRRALVANMVALFQSRFPHSRIVLTSRTYAYREPCLLPAPFLVATLQPLDTQAQDDFIGRWYRAALLQGSELATHEQGHAARERGSDLQAALDRRPRLREIAANPLLLTMVALLHLSGLGLPQQRAELYQACLLLLLEQWEQRRADGRSGGLAATLGVPERLTTTGERLALIQPIAYQLQTLGREEARQGEVKQWLLERFLDLADEDGKRAKVLIEAFLAFLEGRSGLLIARDLKDRYAFPHKTFQEYLAARELIYQGTDELLRQTLVQRHAPTWREVILLTAGHLVANSQPQQAKQIAWRLLDADASGTPGFYRSAALAGEIVEELGDSLGRDGRKLRDDVVQALIELVQGGHLGAKERVEAAFLLGRLGDGRLPMPDQPNYWCAVEPGPFWHGDDREEELQQVELPYAYEIARYPVTNAEFARFIDAGGYQERRWWTEHGWAFLQPGGHRYDDQKQPITQPRLWEDSRYNSATQPIVAVSWYEAAAYCTWLTEQGHVQGWLPHDAEIRLPTWLEWERAARHTDRRRYPWSDDKPDVERTNYQETGIGRPAPVGCFSQGIAVCGAHDMVGNVLEWTATDYEGPQALTSQKDFTPQQLVLFAYNDYTDNPEQLCCGARIHYSPDDWYNGWGIRDVRTRTLIG